MATKERLISSAVELIVAEGSIDRVSMRSIAKRAGVSPTAVYRHYANFEELVAATMAWTWLQFDLAVNGEIGESTHPHATLQASGEAYLRFALAKPGMYRVLFSIDDQASGLRDEFGMPVFGKLVEKVDAVLQANNDEREPLALATSVFTWIHGIADLQLTGLALHGGTIEEQVRSMMSDLRLSI